MWSFTEADDETVFQTSDWGVFFGGVFMSYFMAFVPRLRHWGIKGY